MTDSNEKPRGGYGVIPPQILYDDVIEPAAKLLYAAIAGLTDMKGYCWATNSYFCNLFKLSKRTVQNHLKSLHDAGFITITDGNSKNRKIYAGINPLSYRTEGEQGNGAENCTVEPCRNLHRNRAEICTQNNINNNIPPKAPQGAAAPEWKPDRFVKFWEFYQPHKRRGNKQRAIKAWDKLRPDDDTLILMGRGLLLQMADETWERGIGVPYVSSWLNRRDWESALENAEDENDDGFSGWAPDPEVIRHV